MLLLVYRFYADGGAVCVAMLDFVRIRTFGICRHKLFGNSGFHFPRSLRVVIPEARIASYGEMLWNPSMQKSSKLNMCRQ